MLTIPASGRAYHACSPSERAAMAVAMRRQAAFGSAETREFPAGLGDALPQVSTRRRGLLGRLPVRRRVRAGIPDLEAALCGRAYGWDLRDVSARWLAMIGPDRSEGLVAVYEAADGPRRNPDLVLWVFADPARADAFRGGLRADLAAQVVAGTANLLVTSACRERRAAITDSVRAFLADLATGFGPAGVAHAIV